MTAPYFARFIGGPQDGLEKEMDMAHIRIRYPVIKDWTRDPETGKALTAIFREHFYRLAHRNGKQLVYRYEG